MDQRVWSEDEADFWIVVRRRGGWNAKPEVVGIHDGKGGALFASCCPEMWDYDPPIDETDVLTCHPVLPSIIVTVPEDVVAPRERPQSTLWVVVDRGQRSVDDSRRQRLVLQRWGHGEGVFFLVDDWKRLKQVVAAISGASTWGEFEDALPPGEFDSLLQWQVNDGEHVYRRDGQVRLAPSGVADAENLESDVIDASDPFDCADLFGYCDGDYPRWTERMFEDLPDGFVEEFGSCVTSFLSGSWTQYPLARVHEMRAALRELGYDVVLVADYP